MLRLLLPILLILIFLAGCDPFTTTTWHVKNTLDAPVTLVMAGGIWGDSTLMIPSGQDTLLHATMRNGRRYYSPFGDLLFCDSVRAVHHDTVWSVTNFNDPLSWQYEITGKYSAHYTLTIDEGDF